MKIRFAIFFAIFSMIVNAIPVFALTDGDWEYTLSNNTACITKYNGTSENITIPATFNGAPVVEIGNHAFSADYWNKNTTIKTVIFLDSVITVGERAFEYCDTLTDVVLGKNLETINAKAFMECRNINNISFPQSLKKIGESAFSGCTSLSDIILPDNLTTLELGAFADCNITKVTLPNNLEKLDSAFLRCPIKELEFPGYIKQIPERFFEGCTSLQKVYVGEGVETIKREAFSGCTNLETVLLPSTLKSISSHAFLECSNLKNVFLPKGLEVIEDYAFQKCINMENMIIPNGVTKIGNSAFIGCINLESLSVPKSTWNIDPRYNDTPKLIIYTVEENAKEWNRLGDCSFIIDPSVDYDIQVMLNNKRISFDTPPVIQDGRTLVPLRAIFEAIGATVQWNEETQTVKAIKDNNTISMKIQNKTMQKNEKDITLDVPPQLVGDRTLVPVRAVAESFDCDVSWIDYANIVEITYK